MADTQDQGGMPAGNGGGTPQNQEPLTFEGWIATQDEAVKGLLDTHTNGLKSALQSERESGTKLKSELKKLTKELDEGTEARKQLEGITAKLDERDLQIAAYETLTAAGVTNLKLAWLAARESGAIDARGNINIETLKVEAPELFKKAAPPPGNAGSGQNNGLPATGPVDMDTLIRQQAGVMR